MFDTFPEGIGIVIGVVVLLILVYYLYKHETKCSKNSDCKDSKKPYCVTNGPYTGQCTSAGVSGLCCASTDGSVVTDTNCDAEDGAPVQCCLKNDGCIHDSDCSGNDYKKTCVTNGPFKGFCTVGNSGRGLCCVTHDGSTLNKPNCDSMDSDACKALAQGMKPKKK